MSMIVSALVWLAVIGSVLTSVQALLVWRFTRGHRRPFARGLREQAPNASPRDASMPMPRVSILKPLCGLDDELGENLDSFTRIEGVDYEVILSVEDPSDPALKIARDVCARHPGSPFRVVVGEGNAALRNGKINRLAAAAAYARGDILLVSDSNVRMEPGDLAATLRLFDDPDVGCVTNLFTGEGATNLSARIESLHLLSFVVAGNVLAAAAGMPCVVGKSMALRRAVLESIGGFEAFGHLLAEDQAIGLAVHESGYRVVLAPVVVRNVIRRRTLKRALGRQIRWNKIRYSFSRVLYAGEFLLNPLPLALLAAAIGTVFEGTVPPGTMIRLLLLLPLLRIAQLELLSRSTGAGLSAVDILLVPVQDLLQFAAQFVPFVSRSVTWRGRKTRLGRGTEMIQVPPMYEAA
ncbi:MAG TPA: glycosyltransferase [Thermoanaerobaculia bacterium]|nr:glycosyltransferase [Thermoanaerobaculia bacterium]